MGPLAQQRGLTKPGRGGDEGELAVQPRVQPFNQARARDQIGTWWRDIEFGGQEWRGHFVFSGSISQLTLLANRKDQIPQFYHILFLLGKSAMPTDPILCPAMIGEPVHRQSGKPIV